MHEQRSVAPAGFVVSTLALAAIGVMSVLAAPGDVDPAFGRDGTVTTDFFGSFDRANAVVVDRFGRILVAGFAGSGSGPYFTIVRYNSDGAVDSTFGAGGVVFTAFQSRYGWARAIALDAADRIVVVGSDSVEGTTFERIVAARYLRTVRSTTHSTATAARGCLHSTRGPQRPWSSTRAAGSSWSGRSSTAASAIRRRWGWPV